MGGPLAAIPCIGWGKPTPVNPLRWHNKDLANVMVSIAGIFANLLIALIAFTIFKVADSHECQYISCRNRLREPLVIFLDLLLIMNVSLAIFNLLPFPPLDGSKILDTILPPSCDRPGYAGAVWFYDSDDLHVHSGFFGVIFRPVITWLYYSACASDEIPNEYSVEHNPPATYTWETISGRCAIG